ncbi:hypothetical protein SUGI_0750740 [Cryptomeria japonica]|nr:hypothetical protein SUGI_0750740 [Cryptomeria japonica]
MPGRIHPKDPHLLSNVLIGDRFCNDSVIALTVWKHSLVFSCNGFTVFDPDGKIVFKVDNYYSDPNDHALLMDDAGNPLLTMQRKRFSLHHEWEAFIGGKMDGQKPLFVVKRRFLLPTRVLAQIYVGSINKKSHPDYQIEGSYAKTSCTVYNSSRNVVVEMRRKQVTSDITLGGDVFSVIVQPGYDQAFVMGLANILHQVWILRRQVITVLKKLIVNYDVKKLVRE